MIVVVGVPSWRTGEAPGPDGRSARIAIAAAEAGARVELVGRVGDDPPGDALLLALSRTGVGHAAVLRDPARATPLVRGRAIDDDEPSIDAVEDAEPTSPGPGTAAVLKPILDGADLELGLRYQPDFGVLVVADPVPTDALRTVGDAAAYTGAAVIVITTDPDEAARIVGGATVLVPPTDDEGPFATLVGRYAAGLDRGTPPEPAFQTALGEAGWDPVPGDRP